MTKPRRVDPIASLMRTRRAAEGQAYSAAEVDKILSYYKKLQDEVANKDEVIQQLERDRKSCPVTGLANRRTLIEEVERSLATAKRYGRRHALLKIEVNDFEGFEAMGAETAVAVLTHIARLLRQNIRATDIAARPQGNQFCVILNELRAIENAEVRAAEISSAIAATPCVTAKYTLHTPVTVGYYVFGMDDDVETVFARAGEALAGSDSNSEAA